VTLLNQVTSALTRAEYCKARKKNSTQHYREAFRTNGLVLARENQKKGCHYTRAQLDILNARKRATKSKPRDLFDGGMI